MLEFFADNFSCCVWLAVLLISLIPTLESKIAIPFGMSVQIFGDLALSPYAACLVGLVGSLLPSIFIILLTRKLKSKTTGVVSDKLFNFVNLKVHKHFEKFDKKSTLIKKCIYLAGFVAIPLPLTGVYTGSIIAGLSNLKIWQGFLSILIGEVFACVGMTLLCTLFENSAFYIFMMALVFVVVLIVANFVIWLFTKIGKKKKEGE